VYVIVGPSKGGFDPSSRASSGSTVSALWNLDSAL
jgi:hypothetical protein